MTVQAAPRSQVPAVVLPVSAAGLAALVYAAYTIFSSGYSASAIVGVVALLAASTIAERFPVPLDGVDSGGVSLTFVFGIAAIVLWGWEAGAIITVVAPTIVQLLERRPPVRIAYNAGVFSLSAGAAGLAVFALDGSSPGAVVTKVAVAASASYLANVVLVGIVVAESSEEPIRRVVRSSTVGTIVPFALMASASLILVVLWQRTPGLAAALVGPLLAIALYQRSHFRALRAMRLALTDPLTGLGNHRHFHERLQREIGEAETSGEPLTLCLLDVDEFKAINDRFGHPVGDHVLSQLATRFRQDGETFRLGGDEFAILLPRHDESRARVAAASIVNRIRAMRLEEVGDVTISLGMATYPVHGTERDELVRLADSALYWAKENGKNQLRVYRAPVVELADLQAVGPEADQAARFRAAASLAKAVDARDTYTGSHSERVAEMAGRLAARLGMTAEDVQLARLAGSLHDLGKLAVPEEILRKAGPLDDDERAVLERHPQIGYRMLEGLGVDPVAQWVLHHHERWDGTGYPDGLRESEIPLGARILFVADAFDAMTSQRAYQTHFSPEQALAELERCAGLQFDAAVVAALAAEVGRVASPCENALAS